MNVEFAAPYTAADGKSYKADQAADLPVEEALKLLHDGLARHAAPTSDKTEKKG